MSHLIPEVSHLEFFTIFSLICPLQGSTGEKGELGEAGSVGASGPPGMKGERGERGPPGPTTIPDMDGEYITIKGEKGDQGKRGRRGKAGPEGPQGPPGKSGIVGEMGMPGWMVRSYCIPYTVLQDTAVFKTFKPKIKSVIRSHCLLLQPYSSTSPLHFKYNFIVILLILVTDNRIYVSV
jgi:hypothetical protein